MCIVSFSFFFLVCLLDNKVILLIVFDPLHTCVVLP